MENHTWMHVQEGENNKKRICCSSKNERLHLHPLLGSTWMASNFIWQSSAAEVGQKATVSISQGLHLH